MQDREALAAELERHVAEEGDALQAYRVLSDRLTGGALRALVDHIVTEEEMHHFLLRTLCDWLRTPPSSESGLAGSGFDAAALRDQTRSLMEHERHTVETCRALQQRLSGADAELLDALLEAVALDSCKHERLLQALERLLG
jgi:rubrerythrin